MAIPTKPIVPDLKSVAQTEVRQTGEAFNPMQDLLRSQKAVKNAGLPSGGFTPPTVPTTFNAGELGKQAKIVAPPATTPAPVDPFVQSLQDSAVQYQAMQDKAAEQVKPFEEKQNALTTRLEGTLNKLTGRGQAQLDAEANLGVPEDTARLKEINLQVANLTNDFNRRIASIPGQGRGITTGIVQGQTDRERRLAAVEIGALTSVQQALQGNIALSQQTAERTVAMEFADEEQEVRNLQTLLELNSENLSRADKKRAEELSFSLQERERQIADAKEERKQVLNLSAEAAKNGADTSTLTQMSKAKTTEEALSIGGSYLGETFRQQQREYSDKLVQQDFENSLNLGKFESDQLYRQAQIDEIYGKITENLNSGLPINVSQIVSDPSLTTSEKNSTALTSILQGKIGQGTRTTISTSLGVIKALEDMAENNPDGDFSGVYPGRKVVDFLLPQAFKRKETIQNEGYIDAINLKVQQWASGASLTNEQIEQVRRFTPSVTDTDSQLKTKMNSLGNFMMSQVSANLQSEGVDFQPVKIDLFETNNLLDKASPEQLQQLKNAGLGFNQESQTSLNGSDVSKIKNNQKVSTSMGTGTITGIDGSKYWKAGLDFVLSGGKGAPVQLPYNVEVVDVKSGYSNPQNKPLDTKIAKSQNGGFGNQVKVKLQDGTELWVSHLDSVANIKKGQTLKAGTIIGKQGNTGLTYGNTGTHLDLTGVRDGKKLTARQVASLLNTRLS